jgi:long-chain fatty acid transport protein
MKKAMQMKLRLAVGLFASSLSAGFATEALASSGIDSPENGAEQVGRGSAWLARADTPLAAYYNPAALVTQATGVELGVHLMFKNSCFERKDVNGNPVSPGNGIPGPGAKNGPKAEICTESHPFPNPQIAANFRISNKFALGIAVMGPHAAGKIEWPESLDYENRFGVKTTQPAAQRYLLVSADSLILNPTISVGYAITDDISVGAGFIWGIASVEFVNYAEILSPVAAPGTNATDDFDKHQDVRAKLNAKDLFVPGFVLSARWAATNRFDVAGWFKWQDAIRANTDLEIRSKVWATGGAKGPDTPPGNLTDKKDAGTINFKLPMEARLGLRYHHPRASAAEKPAWITSAGAKQIRDPMTDDLFDVELDFTWAHNSVVDNLELRFQEGIAVAGTPGYVPVNSDVVHNWKDVVGARLGGEYVPLPGRLALRAGGYFETQGQDDAYLNPDFDMGSKVGLSGGASLRLGPVDVAVAYQHTFYGTLDTGGTGAVYGLSGDASTPNFRTRQAVNGGKLTSSLDEVALSGVLRW